MATDTVGSERTARFFGGLAARLDDVREADGRRRERFFTELTPRLTEIREADGRRRERFFDELTPRLREIRGADRRRCARFFGKLAPRLQEVREIDRLRCARFFEALTPQLREARVLEQKLDREQAPRFKVFDYLRQNETTLSDVIVDLLSPEKHGQATLFLRTLLTGLKTSTGVDIDAGRVSVVTEREITNRRRIDISVDITFAGGERYCLAIENKPYAVDQEDQVKDYLAFLEQEYGERFLLVYLSPRGRGPSESSISRSELDQWRDRFAILGYCERSAEPEEADGFEAFRNTYSLVDWLGECRQQCDVERLRWFLHEAEQFCRSRFGGHIMTTDNEQAAIRDFVLSDADHAATAWAVQKAWPAIRDHVCRKFLEAVRRRIEVRAKEELEDMPGDVCIHCRYGDEYDDIVAVWLYLDHWKQYNVDDENDHTHGRTSIRLEAEEGVREWYTGIKSPIDKSTTGGADLKRRTRLDEEIRNRLGGEQDDEWSFWEYVDEDRKDWEPLVYQLHRECKEGRGELIEYYADRFIEVAKKAVPIINAIDG